MIAASLRTRSARAAITFALAVLAGLSAQRFSDVPFAALVLVAPVAMVAMYLWRLGPHVMLAAFVAGTCLGMAQWSASIGPIDARATDAAYIGLVLWYIRLRAADPTAPRVRLPQLLVLLLVLGASLIPTVARSPADLVDVGVSWGRLVQTVSVAWLVPYAAATAPARRLVIWAFAMATSFELVRAVLTSTGDRLTGRHGPNAEGLLAALLLIVAVSGVGPRGWLRVAIGAIAVVGLIEAQSIASLSAVALALGIIGLRAVPDLAARDRASLLRPARLVVLAVAAFGAIAMLRPENLPTSSSFEASSSTHRALLGYAGLEILRDNPILGVGWQRSSLPNVIGTEELDDDLRDRFPDARDDLFPIENPQPVHNTYIQIAAEAGLVGIVAAVLTIAEIVRLARRRLRQLEGEDLAVARLATMALLTIAVWWNDNTLYGAQPETVLFAVFLGLLISLREPSSVTGDPPAGSTPAALDGDMQRMNVPRTYR